MGKSHQHNVLHRCLDCLGPGYKGKRECVRRMKMPIFRNTSNSVLCNYWLDDLNSRENLLLRTSEESCQNTEKHNTQEKQIAECLQSRSLCLASCRCGYFSINSELQKFLLFRYCFWISGKSCLGFNMINNIFIPFSSGSKYFASAWGNPNKMQKKWEI